MDLALPVVHDATKGGEKYKNRNIIFSSPAFHGHIGNAFADNAIAEDGILSEDQLTGTSYCHEKFPAIRQSTFGDDQPALKDSRAAQAT